MTVISVDTDYESLTITLIADFEAPISRVWGLWSDPRKLERWLGPPAYPASVEKHELTPGGDVTFLMTGPDGDTSRGIWRIAAVDPPTSLEYTDAFADADWAQIDDMPVSRVRVRLTERAGATRMEMQMTLESREDLEKLLSTGVVQGLREAVGQVDALLTARP
ncbi:MAG: SRPBCC family protein [Solirubrobacteraceae bacterium]